MAPVLLFRLLLRKAWKRNKGREIKTCIHHPASAIINTSSVLFYQYLLLHSPSYFKANLRKIILFPNTTHISLQQTYTLKKYNHSQASDFSSCFIGALLICLKQYSNIFYTLHLVDMSYATLFKYIFDFIILLDLQKNCTEFPHTPHLVSSVINILH